MLLPLLALSVVYQATEIPIISGVGVTGVSQGGRAPVGVDTVQDLIVNGKWKEPHAGDTIVGARGNRTWEAIAANKDGVFEGGATQGGYVDCVIDSEADKAMLLQAAGDTMV